MRAEAAPILSIFEKKVRLEVPLFQRQYVWSKDQQWLPLWEDISRKFCAFLDGCKEGPVHFLGAMVLDQKQTLTTHVERRQIIDGQQRLITFQIFLAAFRDFCRANGRSDLAEECDLFILNKGMMADPQIDKFKVWPTQLDRLQFQDVITLQSKIKLEEKYPLLRRKYTRYYDPRPRMVEAYSFFNSSLDEFFNGTSGEASMLSEQPLEFRLEECFNALKSSLHVVIIDLDPADDAQVIFETLNARGEPLLPADLLRNFIFLRASRQGEDAETLYREFWRRFDDDFWRKEVRQGRLNRPRSDLFLQHFLASRQTVEIPIKHLFVEYKFWISSKNPFLSVRDELSTLARQGEHFRRIIDPKAEDKQIFPFASFLNSFDMSTVFPLLLSLFESNFSYVQWNSIARALESYIVRRAVCNLTTKSYNRTFLNLTRALRREGASPSPAHLHSSLAALSGPSSVWPRDEEFRASWRTLPAYTATQKSKIVHILKRLNDSYLPGKAEDITIHTPLTLEHILPQNWIEHWPLQDGSRGLTNSELLSTNEVDSRAQATRRRNEALQTLGNLTVLTQPLNSSLSNASWPEKKPAILAESLLPINHQFHSIFAWDEESIDTRSMNLFEKAVKLWPGPDACFD